MYSISKSHNPKDLKWIITQKSLNETKEIKYMWKYKTWMLSLQTLSTKQMLADFLKIYDGTVTILNSFH